MAIRMDEGRSILKVATLEEAPFLMLRDGQHIGYLPDLMNELARMLNLDYEFVQSVDGKYGAVDREGNWNGMIGMLIQGGADLAVAPLTITSQRMKVVDFTKPYMSLGISMLTKVPPPEDAIAEYSLIKPFQAMVWCMIAVALLVVALALFLLNRYHPAEHRSRYKQGLASEKEAETYSFTGSLWIVFTSLLHQGRYKLPRTIAGRIVLLFWFIFSLFTVVMYAASMVRMLSSGKRGIDLALSDVLDVVQSDLTYGFIGGGSTMSFFRDSTKPLHHLVYPNAVQVSSMDEAIQRVNKGDFVFFGESPMLDYQMRTKKSCDLVRFGGLLDQKSYGIATGKGSVHRDRLSSAILELEESGTISLLWDKWFSDDMCQGRRAILESREMDSHAEGVSIRKFYGPLVLLALGLVLASISAVIEAIIARHQQESKGRKVDV